ncbi:MAG: type II toxin-antitoxin system VapC family toxin [bacterium]|nr:type II toxin-antitoxin system VapC family toxin [bacterium]
MRLLLDTCTFLWILADSPQLSFEAVDLFTAPENEVYLSSVSTWEIAVKNALGRLPLPERPTEFVPAMREAHGIESLSLDEESTLYVSRLPSYHKDPFDRMLVCQALVQDLVLLTPDDDIRQYPVKTRW